MAAGLLFLYGLGSALYLGADGRVFAAACRKKPDRGRKALVVISGHWEEKIVTIQNNPAPPLLYDYYGFPESTYQITFPAPGAPKIATRISELLKNCWHSSVHMTMPVALITACSFR